MQSKVIFMVLEICLFGFRKALEIFFKAVCTNPVNRFVLKIAFSCLFFEHTPDYIAYFVKLKC